MTTKVQAEFLAAGIISDQTQVSAADADHVLIFDASDNSLKKALVSTITSSGAVAADDITAGDGAVTISTTSGDITIDNGSSDDDIIFKGTDGGSDITALRLDMSSEGGATFNGNITLHDNKGVYFGAGSDLIISSDGTDATLDASGDITIDAGGEHIRFKDDGTERGNIDLGSANFTLRSTTSDKDIIFRGNDGGTDFTALTLDMSEAGAATFNSTVAFKFINNTWYNSADGRNRFYFTNNGETYIKYDNYTYLQDNSGNNRLSCDSSGNLIVAGNVTAYGSPSDIVLKENVSVIDNAMEKVNQLKGITYDLKSDGNRLTGLVAQDLEKVLPEAVYTTENLEGKEHLAIRYGNTVGLLVEAIKELSAKIEKLEGK